MQEAQSFIDAFNLLPHPEGGFYREVHRAQTIVKAVEDTKEKSA